MATFFDDENVSSRGVFAPLVPEYVEDVVLSANVPVSVYLPLWVKYVVFSFNGDFRFKLGVDDLIGIQWPNQTTNNGSGSILNPAQHRIPDKISTVSGWVRPNRVLLIAPSSCQGSLVYYN